MRENARVANTPPTDPPAGVTVNDSVPNLTLMSLAVPLAA